MAGQTIFANICYMSTLRDTFVNVFAPPYGPGRYFAHMCADRDVTAKAAKLSEDVGNGRCLYRIRVIPRVLSPKKPAGNGLPKIQVLQPLIRCDSYVNCYVDPSGLYPQHYGYAFVERDTAEYAGRMSDTRKCVYRIIVKPKNKGTKP